MIIFIGSSTEAAKKGLLLQIARIVEENGHTPICWNRTPSVFEPGMFTLEALEELSEREKIEASIFLFSHDDTVWYRGEEAGKPRDNVIFEHGLFLGKLGRNKSIILKCDKVDLPSDLLGVTYINYSEGARFRGEIELNQWLKGITEDSRIRCENEKTNFAPADIYVFSNLEAAKPQIMESLKEASEIRILANKGLEFFGSDSSVIPLADVAQFVNLRRLKMLLLSPDSPWVNRGFMALRKYESLEDFKSELRSTHVIVEMGIKKTIRDLNLKKSGIKYHNGEPYFRFIMIDDVVYVSSYAEHPTEQVRDLPVFRFRKDYGSLYGSLRKHFNDLWVNNSEFGKTFKETIEIEISAGGIVVYRNRNDIFIALVQRDDGSWVLPKGHKEKNDKSDEENAIREVAEETGLSISRLKCHRKIDTYAHDESAIAFSSNKLNTFFLMEYISETMDDLQADFEHMSAKWWNLNEELPFMFYVYQKVLISETIKREFGIDVRINER